MGTDLDSLSALNTFVRAAEARSFTDAGQQLGLSSSAVGKAVARLEERLGVRLFNRNTRTITLTQEGQRFLESCRTIISEIKSVEQEFVRAKAAPNGKLRVSLPLIGTFMMPAIGLFMHRYPDIELDLDFSDDPPEVIAGGYDAALQTGVPADSRLMSRRLATYRLVIVGSPSYFARAGTPKAPADLAMHSCLHHKSTATGKVRRWPLEEPATEHETIVPTTATASAIGALISLVELGRGLACLPLFSVRRQLEQGSLVSALDDYLDASESIRVTWPSGRFMSPKLRVFIDFLAETLPSLGDTSESERLSESVVQLEAVA